MAPGSDRLHPDHRGRGRRYRSRTAVHGQLQVIGGGALADRHDGTLRKMQISQGGKELASLVFGDLRDSTDPHYGAGQLDRQGPQVAVGGRG